MSESLEGDESLNLRHGADSVIDNPIAPSISLCP
jgi:hypothetical protein